MKDLTKGNEARLIFNFAIPMLLGNVFQQMYSITDTVIVGRFIGKEALVAVGTSFPIIFTLVSFVIGISIGSSIVVSQYFGAKDMVNVKRAVNTLYIFLFCAAIVVTILGISLCGPIFRKIDLPKEAYPQARMYLLIYFSGIIFVFGYNGASAILRGLGDSKTPLYFLILSTVSNALMALLFVVVFHWGVAGSAIATVIAQAWVFFAIAWYMNKHDKVAKLSIRELQFSKVIFKQILRIGLPTGFQQTFVALGMIALYGIVNRFGLEANAAYSVAGRIDTFASMPAMTFAIALSTFVGQNLGANIPERVHAGLKATFFMTSVVSVIMSLCSIFLGRQLMSIFTTDPNVIEIGKEYLMIVGSFYLVFSTMFVIGGVMRGAGDTLIPMFITLFSLWVIRIPLAYFFSRYQHMGVHGIWWAIPIAWVSGMILSYLYYSSGCWK